MNPIKDIKEIMSYPKEAKVYFLSSALVWAGVFIMFIRTVNNQSLTQWIMLAAVAGLSFAFIEYLKYCTFNRLREQGYVIKGA